MKSLGVILVTIGWIALAIAFISGIGVAIYSLGVLEMAFGAALWAGFKTWLTCIVGGAVSFIVGSVMVSVE